MSSDRACRWIAVALTACSVPGATFLQLPVTVGGTVTGLAGGGLVLTRNGVDELAISGNGAFTFVAPLEHGAGYAVEVARQPSDPAQTCTVTSGTGIASADVADVQVTCHTDEFSVGGTVTGLTGAGLVLRNNAGDDLEVMTDGAFTFATAVPSGGSYAVTVAAHPPTRVCLVVAGTGTVGADRVTGVRITCGPGWSPSTFPIAVPGSNNGASDLALDNNGDLLVGVLSATGDLVRVNHTTGAQTTVATGVGPGNSLRGIAYRASTGIAYTSTFEGQIFSVTPTGTVTQIATGPTQLNALTIAPAGFGVFGDFLIGVTQSGTVLAVDPATGVVTAITSTAGPASDLAFAPDGTLYISGGATVRTVTAAGVVAPFAAGFGSADGITIAPDGGRMFIADSGPDQVRRVTIPGGVITDVGAADINAGFAVGGILAAPGNTLIVMTGTGSLTLVAFPY